MVTWALAVEEDGQNGDVSYSNSDMLEGLFLP
jgi:hypothetical protein